MATASRFASPVCRRRISYVARTLPRREEYGNLLPEVPHVGWYLVREARDPGLSAHRHRGWELCWIRRGTLDWWAGDEAFEVPQEHVYITRPGEVHGASSSKQEPCELFWLHVLLEGPLAEVERELLSAPRVFPADEAVTRAFADLLAEHRSERPLRLFAARTALHRLLTEIVRAARAKSLPPPLSQPVSRAMAHAHQHLDEDVAVADLAAAAGLSPSRFHDRFLAETGQTPADWLRRARLRRAKRLLAASDRSVTDIALSLGFPSSQYFATVFRRYTGLSPGDWRSQAGSGPT
jgi:AraC-like DNA-binding protein/mannose-6-phosphate isomerase-like protein (cupin superfamily)